jgi:hypothetical protein
MAYNPSAPVVTKVEINAGALGWVDVTARGRAASCVIQQGRTGGAIQAEPSRLQLTLGNPDGYLTEDNAVSPYYGSWGRGCEIRVSRIGLTVSPAERFHGQIDTIVEHYPGGNVDATVEVTAVGTLGILTQGSDPPHSPLFRTMSGIAPGDYVPHVYWPMEDGSDATRFASGLSGGTALPIPGGATPAGLAGPTGSEPLAQLGAGVRLPFTIPAYSSTQIAFQWQLRMPSEPAAEMTLAEFYASSGPVRRWKVSCVPGTPAAVWVRDYDSAGTEINASGVNIDGFGVLNPTESEVFGNWVTMLFAPQQTGGSVSSWLGIAAHPPGGAPGGANVDAGTLGTVTGGFLYGGESGVGVGHLGAYTDPAFDLGFTGEAPKANVLATDGYNGESAAARMARLCFEEGIDFELTGTAADTVAMGPQLVDTLVANLRDCEIADQGLMHDNGTGGAIGYVTRKHLYNQTATVAVVSGSLEPGLEAIRDSQYVRNDITSTRPNGGFAHVTDENHIAKIRARLKDDRQPNVETDEQLPNDAGWALHIGTAPGARYDTLGINLRNSDGALLADAVETHEIGDRITVASTALPPQHPIDGIDGLTVGWTELLDADTWIFRPNVVPYRHEVFTVGDQTRGRLDTAGCLLYEAATASATSLKLHTYSGPAWITSASRAADFTSGFTLGAAGEQIRPTAIAAVTAPTFVGVGTASSGSSGSRTPGLPAGAVSGDLVLIFASTRNSGTGTVDTPANWTSLLAFGNCRLMGRIYDGLWAMPTVTFTGGAVNEDTIAQSLALRGMCPDLSKIVISSQTALNGSVQDIAYPTLPVRQNTCIVLFLGWKQDDYTSVATVSGATEAQEASSTAGNDASQVWDYVIQSTQADIPVGAFTVTGGAAAISRGAVVALVGGYQIATVTRAVNGVSKAQVAGEAVSLWKPVAIAL